MKCGSYLDSRKVWSLYDELGQIYLIANQLKPKLERSLYLKSLPPTSHPPLEILFLTKNNDSKDRLSLSVFLAIKNCVAERFDFFLLFLNISEGNDLQIQIKLFRDNSLKKGDRDCTI